MSSAFVPFLFLGVSERCARSVPVYGTRSAVSVIPGVPVCLLCAGLQVSASAGAALGSEHGWERGQGLEPGVPVAVVPLGSARH